jgi:Transposase, Mutator family
LAKVPKNAQEQVKADYWTIFELPEDVAPGPDAVAKAQTRIDSFATRWRDSYPAAVRCLLDDRDSLTVYLRFPREHWTRVRHSNFIERTFGETRAPGSGSRPAARTQPLGCSRPPPRQRPPVSARPQLSARRSGLQLHSSASHRSWDVWA